jgi:riboflavin kinase/FMN adenylyltransferase
MQLIRGLPNLRASHGRCAVSIGSYDGIHLGHRALLERLRAHGERLGGHTVLVTFEPLPREYLSPGDPPPRLTSLRERWRLLTDMGIDYLWVLRFDERVRTMSGEAFAEHLRGQLGAAVVVVGHDFRFGRNGEATVAFLEAAGAEMGFTVDVVPPVIVDGARVSSSRIREALGRGDLRQAERWLGRPYGMRGRVVEGAHLGRKLGYPTANLRLGRRRAALGGIFAVRVRGAAAEARPAVASLGNRPTVDGQETLLEAHLFDFAADLYGCEIEVEFVEKLRDEERFANVEALVEQMNRDAAAARRILNA